MDLAAGGIQHVRLAQEPQPRHRESNRGIVEGPSELTDRPWCDDRVGVEEDERVSTRVTCAEVACRGKADVAAGRHDGHERERASVVELRYLVAVVDDDRFHRVVMLALERPQAFEEHGPLVARDDDDGDRRARRPRAFPAVVARAAGRLAPGRAGDARAQ